MPEATWVLRLHQAHSLVSSGPTIDKQPLSMGSCDGTISAMHVGDLEGVEQEPGAEDWEGDEQDAPAGLLCSSLSAL